MRTRSYGAILTSTEMGEKDGFCYYLIDGLTVNHYIH